MTSDKAQAIAAALSQRYPCQVLPPGTLADLGVEFGVTGEYVRQISKFLGMAHSQGGRNQRPRRFCGRCDAEMSRASTSDFCLKCRKVPVACAECGALNFRSAARLVGQIGRANRTADGRTITYTGRVFCNRSCLGRWAGHQNAGKTRSTTPKGSVQ